MTPTAAQTVTAIYKDSLIESNINLTKSFDKNRTPRILCIDNNRFIKSLMQHISVQFTSHFVQKIKNSISALEIIVHDIHQMPILFNVVQKLPRS